MARAVHRNRAFPRPRSWVRLQVDHVEAGPADSQLDSQLDNRADPGRSELLRRRPVEGSELRRQHQPLYGHHGSSHRGHRHRDFGHVDDQAAYYAFQLAFDQLEDDTWDPETIQLTVRLFAEDQSVICGMTVPVLGVAVDKVPASQPEIVEWWGLDLDAGPIRPGAPSGRRGAGTSGPERTIRGSTLPWTRTATSGPSCTACTSRRIRRAPGPRPGLRPGLRRGRRHAGRRHRRGRRLCAAAPRLVHCGHAAQGDRPLTSTTDLVSRGVIARGVVSRGVASRGIGGRRASPGRAASDLVGDPVRGPPRLDGRAPAAGPRLLAPPQPAPGGAGVGDRVVLGLVSFRFTPAQGAVATDAIGHALEEYTSFLVLLGSLFVITGGVLVKGDLPAKPWVNATFLAVGAVLAKPDRHHRRVDAADPADPPHQQRARAHLARAGVLHLRGRERGRGADPNRGSAAVPRLPARGAVHLDPGPALAGIGSPRWARWWRCSWPWTPGSTGGRPRPVGRWTSSWSNRCGSKAGPTSPCWAWWSPRCSC